MSTVDVILRWDIPENTNAMPSVQCNGMYGDFHWEILVFIDESAAHRMELDSNRMVVSSEYRPGYITLFESPREQLPNGHSANSFTPANHIDNLPQNYACEQMTYTYAMEINDGIITIYSDLDENLKIHISTEDFKIFHKAYTHVRTTHQPMEFSVTIW